MKKILLLGTVLLTTTQLLAQQPTTMIMRLTNGAEIRTEVSELEKMSERK